MPRKDVLDAIRKYTDPFRVTKGKNFRLKDFDLGDTRGLKMDKQEAAKLLERGSEWLAMEQDILYAQDSWALMLVFQAMDAAGKDGTIKHVMSRVNPQGVDVFSFKQPSDEELSHDFLWRYAVKVPQRGRIGIFNRSYYEEVLVVRAPGTAQSAEAAAEARQPAGLGRAACRYRALRGLFHAAGG